MTLLSDTRSWLFAARMIGFFLDLTGCTFIVKPLLWQATYRSDTAIHPRNIHVRQAEVAKSAMAIGASVCRQVTPILSNKDLGALLAFFKLFQIRLTRIKCRRRSSFPETIHAVATPDTY